MPSCHHWMMEEIYLCFTGDKAGLSTKVCVSVGNVDDPNSVDNQMLVGIYDGCDNSSRLREAFSTNVFRQLSEINDVSFECENGMLTKSVQWFMTGDVSITSKGHWLAVHVPEFAQRWKFWGLMSEQPIESFHHK
uniref:PLAT domain-containing protein n=1 Tax=Ditylenchus dipsaci TaxID=166011 RepID=A0A915ENP1_9BILA